MTQHDGNVAFKVTYNDQNWCRVCSPDAFRFNVEEKRVPWCVIQSRQDDNCQSRKFKDKKLSLSLYPCYDALAATEKFFSPGWNHGERPRPYTCRDAAVGKLAFLTSRNPSETEEERYVFGVLDVAKIERSNGESSERLVGSQKSSVILSRSAYVKFWDHYSNPLSSDVIMWGSGLFRYVSDATTRSLLDAIIATGGCSSSEEKILKGLRRRF